MAEKRDPVKIRTNPLWNVRWGSSKDKYHAHRFLADLHHNKREHLLAEMEAEADREAKRQIMLNATKTNADKMKLEQEFREERNEATRRIMGLTAEEAEVMKARMKELNAQGVKAKTMQRSQQQSLIYAKGRNKSASPSTQAPALDTRNLPPTPATRDEQTLLVWAHKTLSKAGRTLPAGPYFPTRETPSPFGQPQKFKEASKKKRQSKGTLPPLMAPFGSTPKSPVVTALDPASPVRDPSTPDLKMADAGSLQGSPKSKPEDNRSNSAPPILSLPLGMLHKGGDGAVVRQRPLYSHLATRLRESSEQTNTPDRTYCNLYPRRPKTTAKQSATASPSLAERSRDSVPTASPASPAMPQSPTSPESRDSYWRSAGADMVGLEDRRHLQGELFTVNRKARADTESAVQATRRQLIQHAVDLPSGSNTGILGRTRPMTYKEQQETTQEAAYLLDGGSHAPVPSGQPKSAGWGGRAKSSMSRTRFIKMVQQRHVHSRKQAEREKRLHYEAVRLRSQISSLMDAVIFCSGGPEEREKLAEALATSLLCHLDLDNTSPLSLFPGILEMLLILLEDADSSPAAAACASALARLAGFPEVQAALLRVPSMAEGQEPRGRGHLEVLSRVLASASEMEVKVECGKVVVALCAQESGRARCEAAGLLAQLRTASDDLEDVREVLASLHEEYPDEFEPAEEEEDEEVAKQVEPSQPPKSCEQRAKHEAAMALTDDERKHWKPQHLPVWERPVVPRGMTAKTLIEKPTGPSRRHLE